MWKNLSLGNYIISWSYTNKRLSSELSAYTTEFFEIILFYLDVVLVCILVWTRHSEWSYSLSFFARSFRNFIASLTHLSDNLNWVFRANAIHIQYSSSIASRRDSCNMFSILCLGSHNSTQAFIKNSSFHFFERARTVETNTLLTQILSANSWTVIQRSSLTLASFLATMCDQVVSRSFIVLT